MVRQAQEHGAQIVMGGARPKGERFSRGYWYSPTILTDVRNDMDIMQQEVFGPVSSVMPFEDFDEAIALANDTRYGLSAYLFSNDFKRIMRAVQNLRCGEIYVNRIGPEQLQGFHAGWGWSGQGGDDGAHGYDHYFRKKTVYVNYADKPSGTFMPYGHGSAG